MINWGILGLGRMGLAFANAIEESSNSKLIGIASKSGKNFKDFKNENYENLIHDKNIDAIYISTLNNTHIDLIKKISKEGKKILCEKPVSTSLDDFFEIKKLILEKKIQFYEAIVFLAAYVVYVFYSLRIKKLNRKEIREDLHREIKARQKKEVDEHHHHS